MLSLLHSSGYPFHVCPLGNSIFKKTRGFHLDHIGNSTFSTDYSLTNVWVTDNNHTYVVSNMMSVDMHTHSMCIHFTQKFLTCLCNSFLCFPQTPRVCSQLLVFFLDWSVDLCWIYLFNYFIVHPVQLSTFSPTTSCYAISASHTWTYTLWLWPCVIYMCSLMVLPLFPPIISLPPPFWLLPLCSLFQCLWLHFACLLFSWLGSTNRWDHMVFFFHCLARFT